MSEKPHGDSAVQSSPVLESDKAKRDRAVDAFAVAIKARLDEQASKGYEGWDGAYSAHRLLLEIQDDAACFVPARWPNQAVDIGARAMMLHFRLSNHAISGPAESDTNE